MAGSQHARGFHRRILDGVGLFNLAAAKKRVPELVSLVRWVKAVTRSCAVAKTLEALRRHVKSAEEALEAARTHARDVLATRQRRETRMKAYGAGDDTCAVVDVGGMRLHRRKSAEPYLSPSVVLAERRRDRDVGDEAHASTTRHWWWRVRRGW